MSSLNRKGFITNTLKEKYTKTHKRNFSIKKKIKHVLKIELRSTQVVALNPSCGAQRQSNPRAHILNCAQCHYSFTRHKQHESKSLEMRLA